MANECSICLEICDKNSLTLKECNHKFHKSCLENWMLKKNNCPICRTKLNYTFEIKFKPQWIHNRYIIELNYTKFIIYSTKYNLKNKNKNIPFVNNRLTKKSVYKEIDLYNIMRVSSTENKIIITFYDETKLEIIPLYDKSIVVEKIVNCLEYYTRYLKHTYIDSLEELPYDSAEYYVFNIDTSNSFV